MRAGRLLSLLLLLQSRGRMTAEALAATFEVSVRTIYRDIDQLSLAGVPIYADRGPSGGFELMDGYRTKLTGLSPEEAQTLFLAGLPGPAAELGLADLLMTAQLKLTAALPEAARTTAKRIATRFHLDPLGWFRSSDDARLLPVIASAVWTERCLDIRYKRSSELVSRRVLPLGLVLKAGVWYLVAQVSEQPRTYRISNVVEASLAKESFKRPKDFHLVRFWTSASRAYEVGLYRGLAELRVSPAGFQRLDLLGSFVAKAAAETAGPADATGWIRLTIPVEALDQASSDLIRLGDDVEVVRPPELRRAIIDLTERIRRLYRSNRATNRRCR